MFEYLRKKKKFTRLKLIVQNIRVSQWMLEMYRDVNIDYLNRASSDYSIPLNLEYEATLKARQSLERKLMDITYLEEIENGLEKGKLNKLEYNINHKTLIKNITKDENELINAVDKHGYYWVISKPPRNVHVYDFISLLFVNQSFHELLKILFERMLTTEEIVFTKDINTYFRRCYPSEGLPIQGPQGRDQDPYEYQQFDGYFSTPTRFSSIITWDKYKSLYESQFK